MVTATGRRALSVADLQAGLAAARDGEPRASGWGETPNGRGEARETTAPITRSGASSSAATTTEQGGKRARTESGAGEEAAASRRGEPTRDATASTTTPTTATTATTATTTATTSLSVPTVLVLAAHAGAGASTVAVLIGEAAATGDITTRLVDCADPGRSGLAGATDTELGEDGSRWRRGRRGHLEVDRPARRLLDVEDLAAPRPAHVPASALVVVDAGWPAWEVLTASGWVTGLLRTAQLVLVCRATVPGVRQTEQLLAALPGRAPLVAALGPNRWPGVVTASCGPLLRAARESDRLVCVPLDGHLAVTGLTADPLPRQLTAAGRALLIRLLAEGAGRTPGHPAPTPGRARTPRRKDDR